MARDSTKSQTWRNTPIPIQERNHIHVLSAGNPSLNHPIWSPIPVNIQDTNHSFVNCALNHSRGKLTWGGIWNHFITNRIIMWHLHLLLWRKKEVKVLVMSWCLVVSITYQLRAIGNLIWTWLLTTWFQIIIRSRRYHHQSTHHRYYLIILVQEQEKIASFVSMVSVDCRPWVQATTTLVTREGSAHPHLSMEHHHQHHLQSHHLWITMRWLLLLNESTICIFNVIL